MINTDDPKLAHAAVHAAVKNGTLIKPSTCDKCQLSFESRMIDGHHHNGYDEAHWLDVTWLCKSCHFTVHGLRARWDAMTADERSTYAKQVLVSSQDHEYKKMHGHQLGTEYGRVNFAKANTDRTPEERSALARKAALSGTPEQRSARARANRLGSGAVTAQRRQRGKART